VLPAAATDGKGGLLMSSKSSDSPVDIDQIRELIDLLIEKEVNEFAIERDGVKVKIRRGPAEVSVTGATPPPAVAGSPASTLDVAGSVSDAAGVAEDPYADCFIVTSPMVGTFYRAPEPGADVFVEVGAPVDEGQTLCIIEAMKLMNDIVAEVGGEVAAILANNGEPVEFGQRLFAVRPRA